MAATNMTSSMQNPSMNAQAAAGTPAMSKMGVNNANYGFAGGIQNASYTHSSRSNVVMNASADVTADSSEDGKENLLNKPKTQAEIN